MWSGFTQRRTLRAGLAVTFVSRSGTSGVQVLTTCWGKRSNSFVSIMTAKYSNTFINKSLMSLRDHLHSNNSTCIYFIQLFNHVTKMNFNICSRNRHALLTQDTLSKLLIFRRIDITHRYEILYK